jgi:hypothetical protein
MDIIIKIRVKKLLMKGFNHEREEGGGYRDNIKSTNLIWKDSQ